MTIYVAEISGRGIAAFNAVNDTDAQAYLANKAFLHHLIVFQNQGRPLWDGISQIRTRLASREEVETWQVGKISDEDPFVFLVPVVDPSSFDDDDNSDDDNDHDRD